MIDKRASELIGKNVYDAGASLIGIVVDVKLNLEKGFSLIVSPEDSNPDGDSRELTIDAEAIAVVKDTILLKATHKRGERRCPVCGSSNHIVARYCRECGTELNRTGYALIRGALNKDTSTD